MNAEIERLKLPRGVWQDMIKKEIPVATQVECTYPDAQSVFFQIYHDSNVVARFTLSFLYGCKGVLVSHSMLVSPSFRGQGIAKKLQPVRDKVAKDLQVSVMLCTVREDNDAQKKVIKHWKHLDTFLNIRTGNKVGIHIRKFADDPPGNQGNN